MRVISKNSRTIELGDIVSSNWKGFNEVIYKQKDLLGVVYEKGSTAINIIFLVEGGVRIQNCPNSRVGELEILGNVKNILENKEEIVIDEKFFMKIPDSRTILPEDKRIDEKEFNLAGKARKPEDLGLSLDEMRLLILKYHLALINAEKRLSLFLENFKVQIAGESPTVMSERTYIEDEDGEYEEEYEEEPNLPDEELDTIIPKDYHKYMKEYQQILEEKAKEITIKDIINKDEPTEAGEIKDPPYLGKWKRVGYAEDFVVPSGFSATYSDTTGSKE